MNHKDHKDFIKEYLAFTDEFYKQNELETESFEYPTEHVLELFKVYLQQRREPNELQNFIRRIREQTISI